MQETEQNIAHIILVMSGKGGVGKSTISANLAIALKNLGMRVGILDADLYGPSIPTMFGIQGQPVLGRNKKMIPLERFGLKIMSIEFLLEDPKQAVIWRGPMLHGALGQFLKDVDWKELDCLLIDSPPGTGDIALSLAQRLRIRGALIITTPQEVALQDVYKSVSMCDRLNIPVLGIIENMSFFMDSAGVKHEIFGQGGGKKIAAYAKAPLLGAIALDINIRKQGDQGIPLIQAISGCSAAKSLEEIAKEVIERIHVLKVQQEKKQAQENKESSRHLKVIQ